MSIQRGYVLKQYPRCFFWGGGWEDWEVKGH